MELFEKTLDSRTLWEGYIFSARVDTVELENGRSAQREVVHLEHAGVAVLAIDREDNVTFVRQFRYPYGEALLELPAGKAEPGEAPEECARRELREETGLVAVSLRSLGMAYPSPGFCDERLYIYRAEGLSQAESSPDEDEFLKVLRLPFSQALEMALRGEIKDAKTLVALYRCALERLSSRR